MTFTRKDIEVILKYVEPNLTTDGIFIEKDGDWANKDEYTTYNEVFTEKQEALLNNIDDFAKCVRWLENKPKRHLFNWSANSADLLELAKKSIGEVSHGALIAGAIYCGFKIRRIDNTTGVVFNMCHGAFND